jgi:hypothetical protein
MNPVIRNRRGSDLFRIGAVRLSDQAITVSGGLEIPRQVDGKQSCRCESSPSTEKSKTSEYLQ